VVSEDTEVLRLAIPRELIDLCDRRGLAPATLLRGFIADLCDLHNWASFPREDCYGSNGADQRFLAQEYFKRTYRGPTNVAPNVPESN